MARVRIDVSENLEKYVKQLLQTPTYKPIVDRMVEEAERVVAHAKTEWPVSRNIRGGPKKKKHSQEEFGIRIRLSSSQLKVQVTNAARYVFYIRSRLTGLTMTEQARLMRLDRGEDFLDREMRLDRHRKKSPQTALIVKPVRRAIPSLVDDLSNDLRRIANGER
tara:strand:+ start:2783 stop:3274 length:492 start_codon:yes stop_codon:yes gene_type:complete